MGKDAGHKKAGETVVLRMERAYLNVEMQQIRSCIVCWKYQGFVEIVLIAGHFYFLTPHFLWFL